MGVHAIGVVDLPLEPGQRPCVSPAAAGASRPVGASGRRSPTGRRRPRRGAGGSVYGSPMPILDLTPDALLSTTRSVKRRLDLTRPVPADLLTECVRLAVQAPTSTNTQHWHFVIVTDAAIRAAVAAHYRAAWSTYADGASPDQSRADETPIGAASRHLAA